MQLSTLLTVAGILVSLLFGAWGVYLALKRRYPGQVTFLHETSLPLFDTIVKNLPELKVSFKDKPVGEGLVLLKGALLNTGTKDITPDMIADPIALSLPDGFKWITANLVSHSQKVDCSLAVDQANITFNVGLFRCGEYLRFEALAEVPIEQKKQGEDSTDIGKKLRQVIKTTHRIADTQRVVFAELLPITRGTKRLKLLGVVVGLATVGFIAVLMTYLIAGWPAEMRFTIREDSGDVLVKARYTLDGNVTLKGVDVKGFKKMLPVEELLQIEGLKPHLVAESETKAIFIALGIYILLPLTMCAYAYREQRKSKHLRKLLGMTEEGGPLQQETGGDK